MKKYIIVGALGFAAWYFLIRQKPIKPVVVVPSKDPAAPNIVVTPNDTGTGSGTGTGTGTGPTKMAPYPYGDDEKVIFLIDNIYQLIPTYTNSDQFIAARTKLFINSQPQQVDCFVAPCPTVPQVSKEVEEKAKELIDLLDQYALKHKSVENGGNGNIEALFIK